MPTKARADEGSLCVIYKHTRKNAAAGNYVYYKSISGLAISVSARLTRSLSLHPLRRRGLGAANFLEVTRFNNALGSQTLEPSIVASFYRPSCSFASYDETDAALLQPLMRAGFYSRRHPGSPLVRMVRV
jgi:hypothetical protein